MKFTNKRLVSILLCLAMVLAVLPVAAFAAGTTTLYCAAPDSWTNANVYWWGSAGTNPSWPGEAMTKGADGLWYYEVPSDATNVIFNNKVGEDGVQSSDLAMPTDDKVQFNYSAKEWVAYGSEIVVPETVYYLRGTMNGWGATDALTNNGDGTYSITVSLAAGDYMYKVGTDDWSWSCPAADASLSLAEDCDVTFVLDVEAYTVTANADSIVVPEYTYYVAGSAGLCGAEWDPAGCQMTEQADGTYAITIENVAAGSYEYKIATGSWDTPAYGYEGSNMALSLEVSANVTITFDPATEYIGWEVEYLEEVPSDYIKWQLSADVNAESATADLRLLAGLDSLDYDNVYFVIDGVEYACEAVHEYVKEYGDPIAASGIFEGASYVAAYTIEGIAIANTEIVVSVIYEADGVQTETVERTIVVSSAV